MEKFEEYQSNGIYNEASPLEAIFIDNPWLKMSQAELKLVSMYFKNNAFQERIENEKLQCDYVGPCKNSGNLLEDFLYYSHDVDRYQVSWSWGISKKDFSKCQRTCKADRCLLKLLANIINTVNEFNQKNNTKIQYMDIVNAQLKSGKKKTTCVTDFDFIKDFDVVDLKKAYLLINLEVFNLKGKLSYKFADIFECDTDNLYINKLVDFFENDIGEKGKIDEDFLNEKDDKKRILNLTAFLLNYGKENNIDIKDTLDRYFELKNNLPMSVRGNIFINKYSKTVNSLPYSQKSKDEIVKLFNYINNFRINRELKRVPINIIIYTSDINIVKQLVGIIGKYMWFFGYLKEERYYDRSMNDMVIDRNLAKRIYETVSKDNQKILIRNGIVTINNFSSIVFADKNAQNLILNTLTEQIENYGKGILNVIYGEKKELDSIFAQNTKLNDRIFNIKLDVEELEWNEIADIVIEELEKKEAVSEEIKKKIKDYVKFNYHKSEIRNVDYSKQLYEKIILNENSKFDLTTNTLPKLSTDDVPDICKTRELNNILEELNSLTGLTKIKEQINNLVALLKFNKKANIDISKINLHMLFIGNPGVGKTTVARLVSDILFNLGYTRQDKLVEVSAKDLIADYVGQTSGKTFNVMKSAFGGVLFIDEAYSLKDSNSFSQECIATIVKTMEDFRNDLIIIFAGYKDEMEKFMELNPGLRSRIANVIEFNDYTVDELMNIFEGCCKNNEFVLSDGAYKKVRKIIEVSSTAKNFGNARFVINLFQQILVAHAKNTADITNKELLMTIEETDIDEESFVITDKKVNRIGFI